MSENNFETFNVVLLGKTGNGKSATGNTLLELYRFEEGENMRSETKTLINFSVNPKDYKWTLHIFDTPGLSDAEENDPFLNLKLFADSIDQLMDRCQKSKYNITAFLLVLNITSKYSHEDRLTIDTYKAIFGNEFLSKHCIIVFTFGDIYEGNVDDFVRNQTGSLKQLITTCENRVVLVCNNDSNEKRKEQRKESRKRIVSAIEHLRGIYKQKYGYDDYMKHSFVRYKALLELEKPKLDKTYTEKILEIQQNTKKLSKQELRDKIVILKNEITVKDKGTRLLEKHIHDLGQELEKLSRCAIL